MTFYKLCKLVQITDPSRRGFAVWYRDCNSKWQHSHTAVRKDLKLSLNDISRLIIGSTKSKGNVILLSGKALFFQDHTAAIRTHDPPHAASFAVEDPKAALYDLPGIHGHRKLRRAQNYLRHMIFKYSLCVLIDLLFHGASRIQLTIQA